MLVWAFVTDAIDHHQFITGKRNDGSLYSIYTFSRKIGSTPASVGISGILAAIGFAQALLHNPSKSLQISADWEQEYHF